MREVRYDDPDVVTMTDMVQAEYERRYGAVGGDISPIDAEQFVAPTGAFFAGYVADAPVAMGGWRRGGPDGDTDGEIKRMYVDESVRRHGFGREMLAHIERSAARAGIKRLVLETGTGQPEAIAMYGRAGYLEVPAFGFYADYDDSVHLAKVL